MEARKNHALSDLPPVCFSIYTLPVIPLADKGYKSRSLPASNRAGAAPRVHPVSRKQPFLEPASSHDRQDIGKAGDLQHVHDRLADTRQLHGADLIHFLLRPQQDTQARR